jgi:hypothetical protein
MSPPRDPKALSFPKIVFAPAGRKSRPHIEEGNVSNKRDVSSPAGIGAEKARRGLDNK